MRYLRSLSVALAAASVFAAMPASAADDLVEEHTRVEFGSAWYIRGDIGLNIDGERKDEVRGTGVGVGLPRVEDDINATFTVGGGFGLRLSDAFRTEFTFDYVARHASKESRTLPSAEKVGTPCGNILTFGPAPLYDATGNIIGFDPDNSVWRNLGAESHCVSEDEINYDAQIFALTALYDLPVQGRFRPFVGAGVGIARIGYDMRTNEITCVPRGGADAGTEWCSNDGNPTITTPVQGEPFTVPGVEASGSAYHVAGKLTAGVGYQVTPNTTIDLSYAYTHVMKGALWGGSSVYDEADFDMDQHTVKLGVRYDLW